MPATGCVRPKHRVHLCKNDLRLAGLGDDVDHAAALCECARFALVIGRRVENDRCVRNRRDGAHLADELVAVHGRHEDVADDQMGPFALDDGERLGAVGRLENAVSVKRQQGGQETSIDGAIFRDEDAVPCASAPSGREGDEPGFDTICHGHGLRLPCLRRDVLSRIAQGSGFTLTAHTGVGRSYVCLRRWCARAEPVRASRSGGRVPSGAGERNPDRRRSATIATVMTLALSRRTFLQQASGTLLSVGCGLLPAAAQSPATQVFYDPATLRHEPGSDHPESPKRIDAVMEAVRMLERQGRLSVNAPRPAVEEEVLLVHSPQYVKLVRSETGAGRRTLSTGDTEISSGSLGRCAGRGGHCRVSSRRGVERSRLAMRSVPCGRRGITRRRTVAWVSASSTMSRSARATPLDDTASSGS